LFNSLPGSRVVGTNSSRALALRPHDGSNQSARSLASLGDVKRAAYDAASRSGVQYSQSSLR